VVLEGIWTREQEEQEDKRFSPVLLFFLFSGPNPFEHHRQVPCLLSSKRQLTQCAKALMNIH
jgi:hypothetical protein